MLPKGATDEALGRAETQLGIAFPEEMRVFYLAHDGGPDDEVCGSRQLLPLEDIVDQWSVWKQLFDAGELIDANSAPERGIQARWWIPQWVPVTYDLAGNHDVVDLAPARGGKVGQVVSFWHDDGARTLEGPDFLSWLMTQQWDSPGAPPEGSSTKRAKSKSVRKRAMKKALPTPLKRRPKPRPDHPNEQAAFASFVRDGSEVIARADLPQLLAVLGRPQDLEAANGVFDYLKRYRFDGPPADRISWPEFRAWLESEKPEG